MAHALRPSLSRPLPHSRPSKHLAESDSNNYGAYGDDSALSSSSAFQGYSESLPHDAARTNRRDLRRRENTKKVRHYDEGEIGDIDATITHLDDHAEELWSNSHAVRVAAANAAAAAVAAEESIGSGAATRSTPTERSPPSREETRRVVEEKREREKGKEKEAAGAFSFSPTRNPKNSDPLDDKSFAVEEQEGAREEGVVPGGVAGEKDGNDDSSGRGGLNGRSGGSGVAEAPDLRTHTDLGDLELAAEKALNLLMEEELEISRKGDGGTISSAAGGGGDDAGGASLDESGSDSKAGGGGGEQRDFSGVSVPPSHGAAAALLGPVGTTGTRKHFAAGVGGDDAGTEGQGRPDNVASDGSTSTSHGVGAGATEDAHDVHGSREVTSSAQPGETQKEQKQQQPSVTTEETRMMIAETSIAAEETALPTVPSSSFPRPEVIPAPDGGVPNLNGNGGGSGRSRRRHSTSFVAVAARAVSPAVCRIDMERLVGQGGHDASFNDVEMGQGSGVIFSSEDGLVLTNAHVVAGARKVSTVTMNAWYRHFTCHPSVGLDALWSSCFLFCFAFCFKNQGNILTPKI